MACLTARHSYDFRSKAQQLFDFFLAPDDPKIRISPSLFSLAVSAAAQYMILCRSRSLQFHGGFLRGAFGQVACIEGAVSGSREGRSRQFRRYIANMQD